MLEHHHFELSGSAREAVTAVADRLAVQAPVVVQAAWGVLIARHLELPVIRMSVAGAAWPAPAVAAGHRVTELPVADKGFRTVVCLAAAAAAGPVAADATAAAGDLAPPLPADLADAEFRWTDAPPQSSPVRGRRGTGTLR